MRMVVPMEIGVCCRDLDALARFYVDVLGFTRVNEVAVPAEKARAAGLADGGYRVARLQTPWGERLKLLQPDAPPADPAPDTDPARGATILARRTNAYFTFIVDDLDGMIARLGAAGVAFLSGPEKVEVRPQTFLAFVRDPEGNVLEFVEYGDVAAYRPDVVARG